MLTDLQKRTAQAIVNVFETSRVLGDHGRVTLLPGDPGHLTYGRSQTTLTSGNLHLLVKAYCEAPEAACAEALVPFLGRLAACDLALDQDVTLRSALREAGKDPVMRDVQDAFFDRVYWTPAVASAETIGIRSALGTSVVYDSRVHGAWGAMRDRTTAAAHGTPGQIGERAWVERYVEERRAWLGGHSNALLRRTVYRMDAFRDLIASDRWELPLPLGVRGVVIDETALSRGMSVRVAADEHPERTLFRTTPPMTGDDVRELQRALKRAGVELDADGVFGAGTEMAVRELQRKRGLKVDGIAGPATRSALGL